MTPNRPRRVDLVVDGKTGSILSRTGSGDRHVIDRVVSTGVAAHEGRLFGLPMPASSASPRRIGLVLLCVSSVILWWRRRESGVLRPPKFSCRPVSRSDLLALLTLFGLYLPLFGLSLLAVLLLETLILRRIPVVRDWLGLQRPIVT